jgi:hypothetical protein
MDEAKADLTPLADFTPPLKDWPPPAELLEKIEKVRMLRPPQKKEIKHGGEVVFRVYYDEESEWTQTILKLLPQAYETSTTLFRFRMGETQVYIFKDAIRYEDFINAQFPGALTSWAWALGGRGALYFCHEAYQIYHKRQKRAEDITSDYFRGTIPHEFTHAVLARAIGTVKFPSWLNEGIAQLASSRVFPAMVRENEQRMQRLIAAQALLGLEQLDSDPQFYRSVEHTLAQSDTGVSGVSDAYAQGFHMTRFLLFRQPVRRWSEFIELCRETEDVEKAFQQTFSLTIAEFYQAWREQVKQTVRIR